MTTLPFSLPELCYTEVVSAEIKKRILVGLALAGIVALGAFYRFYDIKNYPSGLFPDEAANGEDVQLILHGDMRPFYPRGNGREALFFYLQALSVKIFGIGVWQMHVAAGVVGLATVLAIYFATRVWFGRLSGLLAALFLATNTWHVTLSRTGFRAIMVPLFITLFTVWTGYAIQQVRQDLQDLQDRQGQKRRRWLSYVYAIAAGASFGLGFYTYIAYRMMPFVALGVVALLLLAAIHPKIGFPHFKRYGRQAAAGLLACAIVLAPLSVYFIFHRDAFLGRAGQVSVFSPDLQREVGGGTLAGTLMYSTRATLLSFFYKGDVNFRHNVSGYPLLNPLVGLLFVAGIVWAIHGTVLLIFKLFKGKEVHLGMIFPYLLGLLAGMAIPVITTAEGMPHALRSLGMLPPIFILAGMAGSVTVYGLRRRVLSDNWRATMYGVVAGLLMLVAIYDGLLYFYINRRSSEAYAAYRGDLTVVSRYLKDYKREYPAAPRPKLVLDKFSLQTVHYLTSAAAHEFTSGDQAHPDEARHIWVQVDPEKSDTATLQPGEIIIFTQSTLPDAGRFVVLHPDAKLIESRQNQFGQEIMKVYSTAKQEGEPSVQVYD